MQGHWGNRSLQTTGDSVGGRDKEEALEDSVKGRDKVEAPEDSVFEVVRGLGTTGIKRL